MFTKAPILYHFHPEYHIRIETNASGYAIGGVLTQLSTERGLADQMTHKPNDLNPPSEIDQWHPVAFFSQKMIPAKTRYKTHDQKPLLGGL